MKKQYRVNVPAVIAFDVVAESEEQAKRIAAAATYTPVEPMYIRFNEDDAINLCVWAATYSKDGEIVGIDGNLAGAGVDVVDTPWVTPDEMPSVEQGVYLFALENNNKEELEAALTHSQAADHEAEQTEAFNKYGMQV